MNDYIESQWPPEEMQKGGRKPSSTAGVSASSGADDLTT